MTRLIHSLHYLFFILCVFSCATSDTALKEPVRERPVYNWDYYTTDEYSKTTATLFALYNLKWGKPLKLDVQQELKCIIEKNSTWESCSSFADFITWKNDTQAGSVSWQMVFAAPDSFSVMQTNNKPDEKLIDVWISIGNELYMNMGLWFKAAPEKFWQPKTNAMLKIDRKLELLKKIPAGELYFISLGDPNYYAIICESIDYTYIDILKLTTIKSDWKCHGIYIYEKDTKIIAYFYLGIITDTGTNYGYTQVYWNQDADIKIEKPEEFMDMSDAEKNSK